MTLENYANKKLQKFTEKELEKYAEEKIDNLETATAGCLTFNVLSGDIGLAFIIILSVLAAAFVYLKFFRGSAGKLFSKLKRN